MPAKTLSEKLDMLDIATARGGVQFFDKERVAHLRTLLENEQREMERDLQRYEATLDSIAQLVWPECTDVQADSPEYLTKLVTRVGMLVRLTQSWDVLQRHVRANRILAEQNRKLRDELRFTTQKLATMTERYVVLEDAAEILGAAYEGIRLSSLPPDEAAESEHG